jgi:hypothetical protein
MAKPPSYAQQLLKRFTLPDGQVGGMLIYDLMSALENKIKQAGTDSLSGPERLVFAVGKLDEMVGSDPGFDGYLKSVHADDWKRAFDGLGMVKAKGYASIARQALDAFGGEIPGTRKERSAALTALGKEERKLLKQLSTIWWEHNVLNSADEEDIVENDDPNVERGAITISMTGPDGKRMEVDPSDDSMPGSEIMKAHIKLMRGAQKPPPRERGIDQRVIDYFVANIAAFDMPMTERDAARFAATEAATAALAKAGSPAKALLALCGVPSPWVYGSAYDSKPRRIPVSHVVGQGAGAAELKTLRKRLGAVSKGPEAFYAEVNGAVLMRGSTDLGKLAFPARAATPALVKFMNAASYMKAPGSGGFALYPIELWDESTQSLREWYESLMEAAGEDEAESYPWLEHATSIGQVFNSADHFVLVSAGDLAGKVLFTDHETLEATVFADSFEEFIGLIAGAPTWFLQRVLSDWRFEAGGEQYCPEAWMEEKVYSDS